MNEDLACQEVFVHTEQHRFQEIPFANCHHAGHVWLFDFASSFGSHSRIRPSSAGSSISAAIRDFLCLSIFNSPASSFFLTAIMYTDQPYQDFNTAGRKKAKAVPPCR